MSNDTTPGGKTQEEIDQENKDAIPDEVAALQVHVEELERRLGVAKESLDINAKRERQLVEAIGRLHMQLDYVTPSREEYRRMLTLATITLVLFFAFTIIPGREPEPVACPPAPACPEPVVAETPAGPPTSVVAAEGYYVSTEMGNVLVPWPDASNYDEVVFTNDCRAVCEVPTAAREGAGRVLVADPAHLLCICFHADTPWPVTRWINWERIN